MSARVVLSLWVWVSAVAALRAAPEIRVLAWDGAVAARELALVSGKSSTPITGMHPLKRSPRLRSVGAGPYAVRALDKGTGADGKPIQIACAIPETMRHALLLLMPDEAHPTGIRPLVIDDNPAGFRWGSYRFLNTTPRELFAELDGRAVRVPPGWKPIDVPLAGEPRGFGVRIGLVEAPDQPLYTAVWEHEADVRTLVFMVPGTDARTGPLAFKAVPENRVALEAEQREAAAEKRAAQPPPAG